MSDQKIIEFRERAQVAVAAPDPDLLLDRGRSMRRRRQLVPVAALAACAAIGIGLAASNDGDARTDLPPAGRPTVTETADPDLALLGGPSRYRNPGTYAVDSIADRRPDATVELFGQAWETWSAGAVARDSNGTLSWGFQKYADTPIDQCDVEQHATTRSEAISQLSQLPGTVTRAAIPAEKLGLSGTYLQLSIPVHVRCPNGEASGGNLMSIWPGSTAPTVTVDVWLLEDGDRLLLLTRAVRGNPSPAGLEVLDQTLDSLQYLPNQ